MSNNTTTDNPRNSQIQLNKFKEEIHKLKQDMIFKSYKRLCEDFGIESTGGRCKKNIIAELNKYCEWEKEGQQITTVRIKNNYLEFQQIENKHMRSETYPTCSYLLLDFLAKKYSKDKKDYEYKTKREIMKIISICNYKYSEYSNDLLDKISSRNPESEAFINQTATYLFKQINNILDWIKKRGLINYDEVYMIVIEDNKSREATIDETNNIDCCYEDIKYKYNLNKNGIRFSPRKIEIYAEIEEKLGYVHYTAIKFYLNDKLEHNANILKRDAGLTDNCDAEINLFICSKLNNLILRFISKIRKKENPTFEEFIDEFVKNGTPITNKKGKNPYFKKWNFNSDDAVVKATIKKLIETNIKIE
ncbi:MAG: hypothetical protein ACXVHO_04510 [Methanobacterium sp.]